MMSTNFCFVQNPNIFQDVKQINVANPHIWKFGDWLKISIDSIQSKTLTIDLKGIVFLEIGLDEKIDTTLTSVQ